MDRDLPNWVSEDTEGPPRRAGWDWRRGPEGWREQADDAHFN